VWVDLCSSKWISVCVEKYNLAQCSSTGVPWNPSVPQNMQWVYVSFKRSVRVPRFFMENDFLLQCVDASL